MANSASPPMTQLEYVQRTAITTRFVVMPAMVRPRPDHRNRLLVNPGPCAVAPSWLIAVPPVYVSVHAMIWPTRPVPVDPPLIVDVVGRHVLDALKEEASRRRRG